MNPDLSWNVRQLHKDPVRPHVSVFLLNILCKKSNSGAKWSPSLLLLKICLLKLILSPSSVFTPTFSPSHGSCVHSEGPSPPTPLASRGGLLLRLLLLILFYLFFPFVFLTPNTNSLFMTAAEGRDCPLVVYLMQLSVFFFLKNEKSLKALNAVRPTHCNLPRCWSRRECRFLSRLWADRDHISLSYLIHHFCPSRRFSRPRIWQRK